MYQTEKEIQMQRAVSDANGLQDRTIHATLEQLRNLGWSEQQIAFYSRPVSTVGAQTELNLEQRAHQATRRTATAYRWLALAGWALAVTALAIPPAEAADMTLPKGMLACDSRAAWSDQSQNLGAGLTVLAPGCVFTNRDLSVEVIDFKVFSGTEVYVRDVDLTIFVDGGVLK